MVETTEVGRKILKILVVDDEPHIREVLQQLLETEGYVTAGADSGAEALELVRAFMPHIVFLDMEMMDQCHKKKSRRSRAERPELSRYRFATIEMAKRALEIGAFDYVGKPLSFDHIREIIRQISITKFVEFM